MNTTLNLHLSAEAIHAALIETHPQIADSLRVDWTADYIHIYGADDDDADANANKIPALTLLSDKATIAADGADAATITVTCPGQASVNVSVYEQGNKAEAITVPVTLTNGAGQIEITATEPGVKVVERIDAQYFARCYVRAQ